MRRSASPELLDDDLGTPAEISASLKDLRHINEWFGGIGTTAALLRRIADRTRTNRLSLLEVGSGAGDVPLSARKKLADSGLTVDVTLLDRQSSHLPGNSIPCIAADATRMPFRPDSFDVVGSTLVAHHFDSQSLQKLLRECLRVARYAVFVNDLIRDPLHLALVYLGLPLFRSRLTWHDAPASVRAAYTVDEMKDILQPLGVQRIEITRHYLYRMGVILWK